MKPSASARQNIATTLSQVVQNNRFNFNGYNIIPVETSTYETVNFRDHENTNSIIYSTSLTACAVILIKNFNQETGRYNDIVTMGHFYPANAYNTLKATDNLRVVMEDFERHGGIFTDKTSIILIGGGTLPRDIISDTTPLGPLLDAIGNIRRERNFKFTHHQQSVNDLRGLADPRHPTTENSAVFVNKDGTAIIRSIVKKEDMDCSTTMLNRPIDSMPIDLLTSIKTSGESFYPPKVKEFIDRRLQIISSLMDKVDSEGNLPDLTISSMASVLSRVPATSTSQMIER
jgi:hypothetical protein